MSTLYAGPGKVYMNSQVLFPEGEHGEIKAEVQQRAVDVVSGFHGRVTALQGDAQAKISLTPFDNWSALPLLFPAYLGVSVGATSGALVIGTRPHGAADVPAKIWTPDGRLYTFVRAAVTKHSGLHLGINKSLFGRVEITALVASAKKLGDAAALYTITESGAGDPGGQQGTDYTRGAWTGVWGTAAGFGGDQGGTPIEAEDEWTITCAIKYWPLTVQQLVRGYKLDSVAFMAKVRPFGPTHSQVDAVIGVNAGRTLGSQLANATTGADLTLSGPSSKTITLKNADVVGAGFEFGGTKLGSGELGFVTTMRFTAGAPQPLLVFSA